MKKDEFARQWREESVRRMEGFKPRSRAELDEKVQEQVKAMEAGADMAMAVARQVSLPAVRVVYDVKTDDVWLASLDGKRKVRLEPEVGAAVMALTGDGK